MKTVRDMLHNKDASILSIPPDATVFAAIKLMSERNIGALPVMDGDKLVGILSERDYARKVILEDRSSKDTLVKHIMTQTVITIGTDNTTEECMTLMTERHLRHLPVIENDRIIGMVSIGDVVKAIISEQHRTINDLHSIINNGPSDRNFRNLLFRELDKC